MQHCSVPVQCVNSTRGSQQPYAAKATFGEAETSLKATVQAEQHEVSNTLIGSDAEEENASNSPVLAIVTKTVGQHITLLPSSKIMQSKTEKETTLKTKKRTLVASTRTSITAAPTTTTTTPSVGRVTNTPQEEKEAKAATSAAVVGGGTEPKQDQQDVSTEEPDDDDDEESDENTEDTKIPIDIARSTIASHLDEKLNETVSTTHSSNENDDTEVSCTTDISLYFKFRYNADFCFKFL
ncbi:unnamed protein product [Cylicostephanus goldi]|uniref:Uncharacterized protein n=1 Tax=Cylicostephanus goldi TaxID=71465 RepID=A0A3P6SS47_CYLGO|nr:unnamed protein product [Cylicostephanus goldi]